MDQRQPGEASGYRCGGQQYAFDSLELDQMGYGEDVEQDEQRYLQPVAD